MRAKRGGKALQQEYRDQGLMGADHPAAKASKARSMRLRRAKEQQRRREEHARRMGIPPEPMPRTVHLPMYL